MTTPRPAATSTMTARKLVSGSVFQLEADSRWRTLIAKQEFARFEGGFGYVLITDDGQYFVPRGKTVMVAADPVKPLASTSLTLTEKNFTRAAEALLTAMGVDPLTTVIGAQELLSAAEALVAEAKASNS